VPGSARGEACLARWKIQIANSGSMAGDLSLVLDVHHITSLDLPELAPYRTLRRYVEHQRERIFVAEGEKVVRRLLESPFPVVSTLLTEQWLEEFRPALKARPERIAVFVAPRAELEKLIGFPLFQGALAVGRIPEPFSLSTLLEKNARPHLLVAVEGLTNAENMGVLVRNCAAFGVLALIVGETCTTPYLRRAVRNSMGTIFKLPIIETPNLVQSLQDLRDRGIICIAAHPHAQQIALSRCDLTTSCCIVLGSEGYGLSTAVLEVCNVTASIPMANEVDSLNVGNAGAVFLYEANRQRHWA
jgi:tRNA G18 (ribose-2'-O)-methylase SpoU